MLLYVSVSSVTGLGRGHACCGTLSEILFCCARQCCWQEWLSRREVFSKFF